MAELESEDGNEKVIKVKEGSANEVGSRVHQET